MPSRFVVTQIEGQRDTIEVFCHYLPSRCSFARESTESENPEGLLIASIS